MPDYAAMYRKPVAARADATGGLRDILGESIRARREAEEMHRNSSRSGSV